MILWKLNELMAIKRLRSSELAKHAGLSASAVSDLRATDQMPRLSHATLDSICEFLQCEPGDLLIRVPGTVERKPMQYKQGSYRWYLEQGYTRRKVGELMFLVNPQGKLTNLFMFVGANTVNECPKDLLPQEWQKAKKAEAAVK